MESQIMLLLKRYSCFQVKLLETPLINKFHFQTENKKPKQAQSDESDSEEEEDTESLAGFTSTEDETDEVVAKKKESQADTDSKKFQYFLYVVFFLFWVTCYAIAIELQFGTVYLLFSALFGIYFNTRTGPKKKKEISAYSVFNKNCEAIDGTIKPEQFEREMMGNYRASK